MDYGTQYLTYSEYVTMGGNLEEMPFNLLEYEARRNVDIETLNRLQTFETIPFEVKVCMFNLVQGMGYDVNYKDADNKTKMTYVSRIIYNSLAGVTCNDGTDDITLLYRGV